MFPLGQLLPLILGNFAAALLDPSFWIVVLLVAFIYKRTASAPQQIFDLPPEPVWSFVVMSTFFGLVGGLVGSLLIILVGISLGEVGISYLWLAAIFLMLIQQRFICFAYAGGLLSLSYLIFGFPQVSVAQVMGLVAILHLVESLLILLSGHLQAVPVYLKTKQGGIAGGFNLFKFWPLPLVALVAVNYPQNDILVNSIQTPDWWPLIQPQFLSGPGETVHIMFPIVAALGYGDIALTTSPRVKTRRAALELALYSLALLLMAILSSHFQELVLLPALFGPLGHEAIIRLGQRREMRGKPLFVQPERGVMILQLLHGSQLAKAGLKSGDVILSVNGRAVDDNFELRLLLAEAGERLELKFLAGAGPRFRECVIKWDNTKAPGYIPAPSRYENACLEAVDSMSLLGRWWKKLQARFGK